ncbi:MAG: hypothetical protein K2L54_04015 [Clostridiales bacterium]|nr:hypothetical protein [Clostridiales bacterium]
MSLKFDEDNNIIGFAANGNFAHDYSGDAANFYVLSDNDYHFDLTLDITEYLTAPSAFEIEFADSAWEASNRKAFAVVYGTLGDEVSVYLETGGKDVAIAVSANTSFMTYDAATHTFKFDMNAVYAAYQEQITAGAFDGFSGVASVDGEDAPVTVAVQILPETPDGLLEMLGELLNKISSAPSEGGNITEQPVQ